MQRYEGRQPQPLETASAMALGQEWLGEISFKQVNAFVEYLLYFSRVW